MRTHRRRAARTELTKKYRQLQTDQDVVSRALNLAIMTSDSFTVDIRTGKLTYDPSCYLASSQASKNVPPGMS